MNIFNKPRIFLSHSSKDKDFINKVDADLRRCQINTWLDEYEMRSGKSWQKMIFEHGIPTCNAVLCYLTDNSLSSKIVEKEMDAALLENLSDKNIAFLPYVEKADLRGKLRGDIKTLHCLEWSKDNYYEILPTVVAEIWHSFMDRSIEQAITEEKNKKLKFEIELQTLKNKYKQFSISEVQEFKYLLNEMNVDIFIKIRIKDSRYYEFIREDTYSCNLLEALVFYTEKETVAFSNSNLENTINNYFIKNLKRYKDVGYFAKIENLISPMLLKYGLIGKEEYQGRPLSRKMYKFIYWLEFYGKIKKGNLNIKLIKEENIERNHY